MVTRSAVELAPVDTAPVDMAPVDTAAVDTAAVDTALPLAGTAANEAIAESKKPITNVKVFIACWKMWMIGPSNRIVGKDN
ncbi:hypothetical protein GCM10010967_27340 [Dyadobacter beijingensis]|uniref:Uncharacterized protein n=1 Tax=Dyadobacter beijingensis TaxID=365489 RepID=A0ABQ2HXW6_9BACT|nr:hypothetical protein GCM10010967_27340 [Dyadobacter beijingensis]